MLSYSSLELYSICCLQTFNILRNTRKILFKHKIWNHKAYKIKTNIHHCTTRLNQFSIDNNNEINTTCEKNTSLAFSKYLKHFNVNQKIINYENTVTDLKSDFSLTHNVQTQINNVKLLNLINSNRQVKNSLNSNKVNKNINQNIFDSLRVGIWNVRSLSNKFVAIAQCIIDEKIDILCLTETWHSNSDDVSLLNSIPPYFYTIDLPRSVISSNKKRGGGLAYIINERLSKHVLVNPIVNFSSFESLSIRINPGNKVSSFNIILIYRPPNSVLSFDIFIDQIFELVENYIAQNGYLYILGDLNIHLEEQRNKNTLKFKGFLKTFGLRVINDTPTHLQGGVLDVIITNFPDSCTNVNTLPLSLSDHCLIYYDLLLNTKIKAITIFKNIRNIKNIDLDHFTESVKSKKICSDEESWAGIDVDDMARLLDEELKSALDVCAPLHRIKCRLLVIADWFNDECRLAKRLCRKSERKFKFSRSSGDFLLWKKAILNKLTCYKKSYNSFYKNLINRDYKDSKKTWKYCNNLLGKSKVNTNLKPSLSANDYLDFYKNKITSICNQCSIINRDATYTFLQSKGLSLFNNITEQELLKIVNDLKNTSSTMDPIPIMLFKKILPFIIKYLLILYNKALDSGIFPLAYKTAIVIPLIKNIQQSPNDPQNLRPISCLPFLGKILEKIIYLQIVDYLHNNTLFSLNQSGFRKYHSTETALLRMTSDFFQLMDAGKVCIVSTLDISAAFDTVDHNILLRRLNLSFGFKGSIIKLLTSFLLDRSFIISIDNKLSELSSLTCGVPQGSILGPLLFTLYTSDILGIVSSYGLNAHAYADDLTVYGASHLNEADQLQTQILKCINFLSDWFLSNNLLLNENKTKFKLLKNKDSKDIINLNNSLCNYVKHIKLLGISIDEHLTFETHINEICRVCMYVIKQVKSISRLLPNKILHTLLVSLVHSKIDYCNSLFYSSNKLNIRKLQAIMNVMARLVLKLPRLESVTTRMIRDLHWLPVNQRIVYKQCCIVYNSLDNAAPSYLSHLCTPAERVHERNLRSVSSRNLIVPRFRLKRAGGCGFYVSGPLLWNALPEDLRKKTKSFKINLKTFLMKKAI